MNLPDANVLLTAADAGRPLMAADLPAPDDKPPPRPDDPSARAARREQALDRQAEVVALRQARGERPVGYKIGFTNRGIWPLYGVDEPLWGRIWNTTLRRLEGSGARIDLQRLAEPRLEPEIVFGLGASPEPLEPSDPNDWRALIACIDWVAPGFEIVHSIWPGWRFDGAQAIAAQGLHGALLVGPARPLADLGPDPAGRLSSLRLQLMLDDKAIASGVGADVLGGPVQALAHLVAGLARRGERLAAGSVVTTGTLTDAQPLHPGQRWSTRIEGAPLDGLTLAVDERGSGAGGRTS